MATAAGLQQVSSICTTQHPALVLTGIFVRLLREHFSSPSNLQYNGENEFTDETHTTPMRELQNYVWDEDNTKTTIQIQSVWEYNTQDIQRRPGLYIKRNPLNPQRIAINDGMTTGARYDSSGKLLDVRGEYHSIMIVGSHTVFCVGKTGAEAELLGQEVFELIMMFAPVLRTEFKFTRVAVQQCGELSMLAEYDEHFVVPIVCSYAFTRAWRLEMVAPWLKSISMDASAK